MVKNLSCVSCAAWNVFPINSLSTLLHLDLAARQVVGCFDNRISYSLVEPFLFRPVPNIRLDLHVTGLSYLKTMNSPCWKLCQKQILD